MIVDIELVKAHIREQKYMAGVERDKSRVKSTGEIFTPTPLVQEMLDNIPVEMFTDPDKTFIDPSCGDGQFLGEVIIYKMENGSTFQQALSTTYGIDLMPDNVQLCRDRLLCGQEELRHIVENNIVCASLTDYHYRFDGTQTEQSKAHWWQYEQDIRRRKKEKSELIAQREGYKTESKKLEQDIRDLKAQHKADMKAATEQIRALQEQLQEQDIKKDIMSGNGIEIVE